MSEPTILCVEQDQAVRESRCAVLTASGFKAISASPQAAEIVLRGRKFDLLVLSTLSDYHRDGLINLADGADILVLDTLTVPSKLLSLVAERLNRLAV
jgi:hypothetical protein